MTKTGHSDALYNRNPIKAGLSIMRSMVAVGQIETLWKHITQQDLSVPFRQNVHLTFLMKECNLKVMDINAEMLPRQSQQWRNVKFPQGNIKAIHTEFSVVYASTVIIWNVSHRAPKTYRNWPMKEINGIALLVYPIYFLVTPLEMKMVL